MSTRDIQGSTCGSSMHTEVRTTRGRLRWGADGSYKSVATFLSGISEKATAYEHTLLISQYINGIGASGSERLIAHGYPRHEERKRTARQERRNTDVDPIGKLLKPMLRGEVCDRTGDENGDKDQFRERCG